MAVARDNCSDALKATATALPCSALPRPSSSQPPDAAGPASHTYPRLPQEVPRSVPRDNPPQVTSKLDSVRPKCAPSSESLRATPTVSHVVEPLTTARRARPRSSGFPLRRGRCSSLSCAHAGLRARPSRPRARACSSMSVHPLRALAHSAPLHSLARKHSGQRCTCAEERLPWGWPDRPQGPCGDRSHTAGARRSPSGHTATLRNGPHGSLRFLYTSSYGSTDTDSKGAAPDRRTN